MIMTMIKQMLLHDSREAKEKGGGSGLVGGSCQMAPSDPHLPGFTCTPLTMSVGWTCNLLLMNRMQQRSGILLLKEVTKERRLPSSAFSLAHLIKSAVLL